MNPVRKNWCITWTLLFAVAACTTSFPLDSSRKIGQFIHTAWGQKEGAPQFIVAIAQTKDGYLWLGATEGLFRFDGVTFEHYQPLSGPVLPASKAQSLLALPNGDLWIGFSGAISLLRNGRAENYASRDGVPDGRVLSIVQDGEGTIWAGTTTGLARFESNRWTKIGKEWNFSGKSALGLFVDRKGTLWVAPEDDSIVFLPRGTRTFQSTSVRVGQVPQMVEAPNGKLWMAETTRSVRPIPLGVELPPYDTVEIRVGSQGILFSREGDLWITSVGDGIRRAPFPEQLKEKTGRFSSAVESFTAKDGLTDDFAMTAFQDRQGNIWVGTLSGLDRFRIAGLVPVIYSSNYLRQVSSMPVVRGTVALPSLYPDVILVPGHSGDVWAFLRERIFHIGESQIGAADDPLKPMILSAYRDPDDVMWLISPLGLLRFEGGHFSVYPLPQELAKPFVYDAYITQDRSGVLWMAVDRGGLFYRKKGIWSRFDAPELSKLTPTTSFTDDLGRVWFGYREGTIAYLNGDKLQTISTSTNSPVGGIGAIQGRNRHVWVGGTSGLALFREGKFYAVVPADKPSFNLVSGIHELADDSLWLCEQQGLIRIDAPEVHKFLETPSYRAHYQVFDSLDGLPGTFQNNGQKLVEGTDGRIWFGADHGIAWLSPATIPPNAPPPISIRSVIAAGKQVAVQPDLTLPPRSENLRVEYTAVNLSVPERVRYRYKLDGVDKDWQDAGVRREAFYTNLGPGKYKFHITARNEGGEWNTEEAALDFRIAPAWFQTIWFRCLCVCVFLSLLWMLYQLRLRQLERQFNRTLDARVAERTRIARELHDTLLQSFSALLLRLQTVVKVLPARPEDAKQRVETAIEQASNAIAEGRDAVHELRSAGLADNDLAQAIGNLAREILTGPASENPPEFRVHVEGTPRNLNPMVRDETYRIAAEALRNAVRHAGAGHIEVEIQYDERQLRLRIRDDGKGIDPDVLEHGHAPGHWGLRGMRERARLLGGNLEVWSKVGEGTEVELTVPAARAHAKPVSRWKIFLRRWRN